MKMFSNKKWGLALILITFSLLLVVFLSGIGRPMGTSTVIQNLTQKTYAPWQSVSLVVQNTPSSNITTKLLDPNGKEVKEAEIQKINHSADTQVKISPPRNFNPGKYTLVVSANGQTSKQDFTWGVLAINANKSIYLPHDTALLQMATLNNYGHTICDAALTLEIEDPSGNTQKFSTFDNTISRSKTCGPDNVTDNPDYYSNYKVGDAGIYHMKLTNTANGYIITDTFEVRNSVPFDIERVGATRINPFKSKYIMNITVKANEDFKGEIREGVPDNFTIIENKYITATTQGSLKVIAWNANMKKGETFAIFYEYDAPKVSPQFYLLGPLRFISETSDVFAEQRQWQVAADGNVQIRQEINIIDGVVSASGDDPAQVQLNTTRYSGTVTAYLEVVAKVASGTLTVGLQAAGSASNTDSVTVTQTSYTRVRSAGFTPSGTTTYQINLANGTTPSVIAARIVIIQNTAILTRTETQIEIGNMETGKTNTTAAALASPKYWLYTAANWDGAKTFYAEVTYNTSTTQTVTATLQQDDGSFGVTWTNVVTIVNAVSSTAAVRTRSVAFTPTDGRHYRISVLESSNAGGISYNIYNAKIIVDQTGASTTVLDKTATATGTSSSPSTGTTAATTAADELVVAVFQQDDGVMTINDPATGYTSRFVETNGASWVTGAGDDKIISSTGTQNATWTTNQPTTAWAGCIATFKASSPGTPIAFVQSSGKQNGSTSLTFSVGTVTANNMIVVMLISNSSPSSVSDNNGNSYSLAVAQANGSQCAIYYAVNAAAGATTVTVSGGGVLVGAAVEYSGATTGFTLLEPQYLLLNTKSTATGLQSFSTLFDPAEWSSVTNTYKHAQDAIGSTANSRLKDIDNANAILTNSSITGANQQIGSAITDMPTAAHMLDTDIVTVGTEIDASRMLVAVSVNVPTKIAFSNASRTFTAGACNGAANVFTMELQNSNNISANPTQTTVVKVTSDSSDYSIYSDSSCSTQVSDGNFTYTTAQSSKSVYVIDRVQSASTTLLTGTRQSGDSLTAGTQSYIISVVRGVDINGGTTINGGTRIGQ